MKAPAGSTTEAEVGHAQDPGVWGVWVAGAVALSLIAAASWLAFSFVFLEYWEPRVVVALFGVLIVAAAVTS